MPKKPKQQQQQQQQQQNSIFLQSLFNNPNIFS